MPLLPQTHFPRLNTADFCQSGPAGGLAHFAGSAQDAGGDAGAPGLHAGGDAGAPSQGAAWKAVVFLSVVLLQFTLPAAQNSPGSSASRLHATPASLAQLYVLPMQFEPNAGQTDPQVEFVSRGPGYTLFLTPGEAVLSLRGGTPRPALGTAARAAAARREPGKAPPRPQPTRAELRLGLSGANPHPRIEGVDELPGTVNYLLGSDPRAWQAGRHPFAKVKYHEVYPGVDLVYYGNQRQLEYDFIVSPGADPSRITLGFGGAEGLEVDRQGGLVVHLPGGGAVRWNRPFAYQEVRGVRQAVGGRFQLKGAQAAGFALEAYDASRPLIIDPVLVYGTYLGGTGFDSAEAIAVDTSGNVYVTGETVSLDFPTTNAVQKTSGGSNDVFVAKLNAGASNLVYSTYLGGSGDDFAHGIAVDSSGNAYVIGNTESPDFPTRNAYQSTFAGFDDAFIFKLGPRGTNLLYSTYFGGTDYDAGNAIAVDNSGGAYVTGETYSGRYFPTVNPFQSKPGGWPGVSLDAFVAKFDTTLSGPASAIYSSWLGGSTDERGKAIAIDAAGNAYVTGDVTSYVVYPTVPSSDFPLLNAYQPNFNNGSIDPLSGLTDGFVTKINAAGSAMVFSTFLGGSDDDAGLGIDVDASGNVYVTGETTSTDFPVLNALQPVIGGTNLSTMDAFVTVLQASGSSLLYSTYLGGDVDESGVGIAVDNFGDIYVTGETTSDNFPVTSGCDQPLFGGGAEDGFVAKINPNIYGPAGLVYASFYGGSDQDLPTGLALDANGNFYVCGFSASTDLPTPGGVWSTNLRGGYADAFIAKFSSPPDISVAMFPSLDPVLLGTNVLFTLQIYNNGRLNFTGVTNSVQIATNYQILAVTSTLGNWTTNNGVLIFNLGTLTNNASVTQTILVKAGTPGVLTNVATLTANEQEPNTANNVSAPVTTIRGIADVRLNLFAAPEPVFVTSNLTYTIGITNKGPWPATSVVVTDALPAAVSYVSANSSLGTWDTNSGYFTYSVGALNPGAGVAVTILTAALSPGITPNTANVTAFELDSNPANNTATVNSTINPLADVSLGQTASASAVFVTSNLTYTISVTNRGPSAVTNAVVTDPLAPGAALVSAQASQGTWSVNSGVFTCSLGSLATGATATVTLTIATPALAGLLTNTATVTTEAADPNPGGNTASTVVTLNPLADIAVSQTASPNPVFVSSNLSYTITVTNRGPSTAAATVLTDPLPPGFLFVTAQSTVGTWSFAGGVVTFSLGDLASATAARVTITAQPMLDGTAVNTASAVSSITDPNTNNTASVTVTVNNLPYAPVLKIARSGNNAVLYWSTNVVGFVLQSSSSLGATASWSMVTNPLPVVIGNQFWVTNQMSSSNLFYRLSKSLIGPSLTATRVGQNLVLSWPISAPGYTLQSTTSLSAPNWKPVAKVPVVVGNQYYVTNNSASGNNFYRLIL